MELKEESKFIATKILLQIVYLLYSVWWLFGSYIAAVECRLVSLVSIDLDRKAAFHSPLLRCNDKKNEVGQNLTVMFTCPDFVGRFSPADRVPGELPLLILTSTCGC